MDDQNRYRPKQFAIVVDEPPRTVDEEPWVTLGTVSYIDVHDPRTDDSTCVINPPPARYTYSIIELREAMARARKAYPRAHVAAHEVVYIDHAAMRARWSEVCAQYKAMVEERITQ